MRRSRTILVDGYNFIGATRGLRRQDLERARDALMDRLARYANTRGHQVVVIFDGADLPVDYYPRRGWARVQAVFTDPGDKADPRLIAEARRLAGRCVVVTNDREVREGCESAGAVVLGCAEFDKYVRRAAAEPPRPERPDRSDRSDRDTRGAQTAVESAEVSREGLEEWERFAAAVTPLREPRRAASRGRIRTSDRAAGAPAEPRTASPDPDLLEAMMEVPDEVAAQRTLAIEPERPFRREPLDRDARRRRNVLKDL